MLEHVSGPLETGDSQLNAWSWGLLPCELVSVAESVWSKCMASDRAVFILSVFLYLPGVSGIST